MTRLHLVSVLALAVSACAPAADQPATVATPTATEATVPRFSTAAIDAMKLQLRTEPKVADLTYDGDAPVQWQIGVKGDGSRQVGYAGYICLALAEKQLVDDRTQVRIVDITKLQQSGGDFRAASLGRVRCRDGSDQGA